MALHGMIDEQFLVGLADKVHRGQEGRVLKGFNPGGKCYGYINAPIDQRFNDELRKRMKELEDRATRPDDLRHARQQLHAKAQHIADAIADAGHSATLLSTLATLEAQIADIDQQLKLCKSTDISSTADNVREFVYRSVLQLQELLRSDPTRLKPVLARHMDQLTLKPVQTSNGTVYEVSGGVNLAPRGNDVMQMVARDGVEPFASLCFL
jgi:hypothetical protein